VKVCHALPEFLQGGTDPLLLLRGEGSCQMLQAPLEFLYADNLSRMFGG
jgi:hypothetical protein